MQKFMRRRRDLKSEPVRVLVPSDLVSFSTDEVIAILEGLAAAPVVVQKGRGFFRRRKPWGPRGAEASVYAFGLDSDYLEMTLVQKVDLLQDLANLAKDVTSSDGRINDVPIERYPWKHLYYRDGISARIFYQWGVGEAFLEWASCCRPKLIPMLTKHFREVVCIVPAVHPFVVAAHG